MLTKIPKSVRIVEVGPRDGLQNEKKALSTDVKVEYIQKLLAAGVSHIEATSFVRADKIPQMGDAEVLYPKVHALKGRAQLCCLVPNIQGLSKAIAAGVQEIAVFTATSETFNKNNINTDIQGSLARIEEVTKEAKGQGLRIRAYVSTVFGCPYEGKTSVDTLKMVTERLFKMGAYEVSLGDTIGVANPLQVIKLLGAMGPHFDKDKLAMHFHDTRGTALVNILASLEEGITVFDSSSGGLGGCPYARGATGNVATEDVAYLMESLGIPTGIDMEKLFEASRFILSALGKDTTSKYLLSIFNTRGIKTTAAPGTC